MTDKELGWNKVQRLTEKVYEQIKESKKKYHWVVSINRGGLIPGVILSHLLDADHAVISVNNYKKKTKNKETKRDLYLSQIGLIKPHQHILLVDNVIRTGDSIKAALTSLRKVDPDAKMVDTAAIHINAKSDFKPTYFAEELDSEDWAEYPWEISTTH